MENFPAQATSLLHTNSFETVYPSVLGIIQLEKKPNIEKLVTAIGKMQQVFPQLFCRYNLEDNAFYPVTENPAELFHELSIEDNPFSYDLDFLNKPQLAVFLRQKDNFWELIFQESHIVADGAGLKQVIACILAFYNDPNTIFGKNHQDLFEVLNNVPKDHLNEAKRADTSTISLSLPFPTEKEAVFPNVQHIFLTETEFQTLREKTKKEHLTLNDVMLTSFMRVLAKYNPHAKKIPLACPTDTRQFLPAHLKNELHLGNFTARYNPQPSVTFSEEFLSSAKKVHEEMTFLKDHYQFLQSVLTLVENYQTQSLSELRENAKKNYHMRAISYTNMACLKKEKYHFTDNKILNIFTSGAFRKAPMFQVCFSSYENRLNLVANVIGDGTQQKFAKDLLTEIKEQLLSL